MTGCGRGYQTSRGVVRESSQCIHGGETKRCISSTDTVANRCRDGVTEDQKPIITRHPQHSNLVIAGGGSYTHAKDLPYIGQIVVEVLDGTKNHTQYGWAESSPHKCFDNQPALRTNLKFGDLELEASKDVRVQRWRETSSDWSI